MTIPTDDIKPDLLISHYGDDASEQEWEFWERSFCDILPDGCVRDRSSYENREGMETLISDFSTIFDGDRQCPENFSTRIGNFSKATKKRIKNPSPYLLAVIRDRLREPEMTVQDAYRFLSYAERRFYRNPLWAWFTLDVFLQAGLPPPPWVWFYLLRIGEAVGIRAASRKLTRRALSRQPRDPFDLTLETRPIDRLLQKVFDIRIRRGRGSDLLETLANDVEGFRLAFRVSCLLRKGLNNALISERVVGEACKQVAANTGRDRRAIRTAYARWYGDSYRKRRPRNSKPSRRAA